MPTAPVTVLDTLIENALTDWNAARTVAFGMSAAEAAVIREAPGLINDPVLGPGSPSLSALNLDWQQFFKGNFETTGMQKILTLQQAADRKRAEGFVLRLRTLAAVQDPVVFNLNQIY